MVVISIYWDAYKGKHFPVVGWFIYFLARREASQFYSCTSLPPCISLVLFGPIASIRVNFVFFLRMNHKLAKPFLNEVTWYLVGSKFQTNKKLVIVYLLPRRCKQTNSFSSLNSIIAKLCVFFAGIVETDRIYRKRYNRFRL